MRLCSIASGSSGNCIYVGNKDTHLLVDAGVSAKKIEAGLAALGVSAAKIGGILVTHEHSDHTSGIRVLSKKYGIPIYASKGTLKGLHKSMHDEAVYSEVSADTAFFIGDIEVLPMSVSHDAAEPLSYRFTADQKRVAIATDLGTYDDYVIERLKNLDAILLEANHDIRMLQAGRYPYPLKIRILSDTGHLSNDLAAELLCRLWHKGLKFVMLGHLSKDNNLAEIAYETVRTELFMTYQDEIPAGFKIAVAKRDGNSEIITV